MPPKRQAKQEAAVQEPLPKIFKNPSLLPAARLAHDLERYGLSVPTSPNKPALVKLYEAKLSPYAGVKDTAEVFEALNPPQKKTAALKRKPAAEPLAPGRAGKGKRAKAAATGATSATLQNPHLAAITTDNLYHIGLTTASDLVQDFGDVKLVCFGGSRTRMEGFATQVALEINLPIPVGQGIVDISSTDRYHMFKTGPVLSVSHGIGNPSAAVILHEVTKLLHYAKVDLSSVVFLRIGTSGGLGVAPGTVVLTTEALNGMLKPEYSLSILGEQVVRPTLLDPSLIVDLRACCPPGIALVAGKTMSCNDFYEGQGRLDGAICGYSLEEKMSFLKKAHAAGARNVEMESLVFSSFCHTLGIRAAVVCVALLDRFQGDQLIKDHDMLTEYSTYSQKLVLAWLRHYLSLD